MAPNTCVDGFCTNCPVFGTCSDNGAQCNDFDKRNCANPETAQCVFNMPCTPTAVPTPTHTPIANVVEAPALSPGGGALAAALVAVVAALALARRLSPG